MEPQHALTSAKGASTIDAAERDLFVPSFAQERLWFLDQLDPDSHTYNLFSPILIEGPLDILALHHTLNALVERHEVLRTTFMNVGGLPMQSIAPSLQIDMPMIDLSGLSANVSFPLRRKLVDEAISMPFDLETGPIMFARLLRYSAEEHVLILTWHHIAVDNWSLQIFWRDFKAIYMAAITHHDPSIPELPIQYADYAEWQRGVLQGDDLEDQLRYWRQQLDGAPVVIDLPTDHPRPNKTTFQGGQHSVVYPLELKQQLRALANREGVTLFMVLLAAYQILLMRLSGQEDIVVGTPIAGRTRAELEHLMGLFVNTLALRTTLDGTSSFREVLRQVREVCLSAFDHQELPFEKLVEDLKPERRPGYQPLFQVFFVLQNSSDSAPELGNLRITELRKDTTGNRFDLVLGLWDSSEEFYGDIEYNADIFTPETITRIVGYFQKLLEGIIADPDQAITQIPLISMAEQQQLFEFWRAPVGTYSHDLSVPEVFEQQALHTPDAVALVWREEQATFAELDRRANQLARYLQGFGLGTDACIGVCLERSPDVAVVLLGVMKSGKVYLPLDPTTPSERHEFMLNNAQVSVILTQERLRDHFVGLSARIICVDSGWSEIAQMPDAHLGFSPHPDDAAYVIYTSGSTGTPKGVVVPHRALVDRIFSIKSRYGLQSRDRLLQFVSLSFDVSLEEIFPTWAGGAAVVLLPQDGVPSLAEVTHLAEEQNLTVLDLPPSYWHEWVADLVHTQRKIPPSVRLVVLGSESSSPAILAQWEQLASDRVSWCNVYGLTETTLIAMTYGPGSETQGWERYTSIPIGRPLDNTQLYVLDALMQPVPIGVPGELYIGGPALARGYLGRPDLTAERFIPDPFSATPDARIYRTGDLVRTLPDGLLEFLGRVDTQVKIRGFRVELGEIETLLRQYPGVREAVVLTVETNAPVGGPPGDTRLAGFVVTARAASSMQTRLQRYLETHLPPYMVPSSLMLIQSLPRTPGGKVDRKALIAMLAPQVSRTSADISYRTPIEEQLAHIWETVLHSNLISREDDFFRLGGHSLQATQVVARIRDQFAVELPVRAMYDSPTIAALAQGIEQRRKEAQVVPSIRPVARDGALPLSFAQQRLWFLDQLEPDSPLYNIPGAMLMRGHLDVAALHYSLNALIARHEPLRTTFAMVDDQPVQFIAPHLTLPLPVIDVSMIHDTNERDAVVKELLEAEVERPFDLIHGPMMHLWLLRLSQEEHILLLTLHHTVADGWSSGIVFRELSAFYTAFLAKKSPDLPALPMQYADFAAWQRGWLQGEVLEDQLAYWRNQLAGAPPLLELPMDAPRPAEISYRGSHLTFSIPSELSQQLRDLSQREGVTLFMLLLATYQTLLMRYTGQTDIVVGTPIGGRQQRETEDLIGLFVNTLALRTDLSGSPTFVTLLQRVREVCLGAYDHQDVPFEKLVDELQPERSLSYTPLFQALFALQHADENSNEFPGLTLDQLDWGSETAKFDLSLNVTDSGNQLFVWLEYNTDVFVPDTIKRLFGHWRQLLEGIIADPERRVGEIPLITETERQQVVEGWNATQTPYPRDATIHALFAQVATTSPDAIALVFEDDHLSYGALNDHANQLAHHLRSLGVGPEVAVGLHLPRSLDLVVGLLAILKAGGFYVPFDPTYPAERLSFMLQDAQVQVVLSRSDHPTPLPPSSIPAVWLDRDAVVIANQPTTNPSDLTHPEHLAYVNYTSGSTGVPKGVCTPHRAVVRLVRHTTFARLTSHEVFLQLATVAFDAATLELWGALLNGARLVIAPPGPPALDALRTLLVRERVSVLWLTAGLFHLMVEEHIAGLRYVRQLLAGGDVLSVPHVRKVLDAYPGNTLINGYGPTEGTTFTCCYPMTSSTQVGTTVAIGRPIANTQVYVLDPLLHPVPVGVPGELYVGGDGVARGYLQRPELTAERFVPSPFGMTADARLYKTGDLVRWLPDGNIEFLGRVDQQVKINGYRIELGEIETVLNQHPAVRECVVIARREGTRSRLVAYVTTAQAEDVNPTHLRIYLKERLPDYMVPSAFVILADLPLNANGKVDRGALPAPEIRTTETQEASATPLTPVEAALERIWSQVLRRDRVGIYDNFFELGGDSILSMQIISRARQGNIHLTPKQLFQYQTIAELATVVTLAPIAASDQGAVSGPVPLTPIQHWFFEQNLTDMHHYNQAMLLEGPSDIDPLSLEAALRGLIIHHDALRLRFTRLAEGWQQRNMLPEEDTSSFFAQVDISTTPMNERDQQIESTATTFQASLNIGQGPLMRAVLFHLGIGKPSRLLIAIHHLAVDGVSWRVLLEDLETAYEQVRQGRNVELPAKTTSFKQWAERLTAYAQTTDALGMIDFWLNPTRQRVTRLPLERDADIALNTEESARTVIVTLSPAETQSLLQEVPKAYHTQINDALLAAASATFREWTGSQSLLVDLEGHGREAVLENIDLSRTVGWFTSIFPVLLDLDGVSSPGPILVAVKEQLRQIPDRGIGYGIIRYLRDDPALVARLRQMPQAEVSFNYLGQFDQASPQDNLFRAASESGGSSFSQRGQRRHIIELLGIVSGNQLQFTWIYSERLHERATIERLAHRFITGLRDIIAHCLSPEAGGHSPSDFPLAHLDESRLSKLSRFIDEEE